MDPANASFEARARARKEAEEAFYNGELSRMAAERAQMASMADRIVMAITEAEARNNETTIQDITSADRMDELISKSNTTRLNSLETLNDLQSSFQEMKENSNYEKLMEEIGPIVSIDEDAGPEAEGKDGGGEEDSYQGDFAIIAHAEDGNSDYGIQASSKCCISLPARTFKQRHRDSGRRDREWASGPRGK